MDMEYCAAAEQQLCRLRQHVFLLAPCSSPSAMAGALEGVARVYEHAAESMARCARADQVDGEQWRAQGRYATDGELEASVALLDACASTRDALGAMRACALDVESAARRRDRAARAYARLAKRACADARRQRRRAGGSTSEPKAADGGGNALQEARRLTEVVLERVATALSRRVAGGGGDPRPATSWSTCVARAFRKSARVACEATLPSLPSKDDTQDGGEAALRVQREMRALGDTIQQLEDGLELLFRRLVQCRVFLLNMRSCSVKV
ncbi:unnamed protein product [Urochloa decumbens]|uniref:Uncharacterized protein n=1 Tax=Urochloa decumbens TaxID=240449 RepID=A0ABC9GZN5_9POAL